jgi:hypothetical protein
MSIFSPKPTSTTNMTGNVISGAGVRILGNGLVIGFATGVSVVRSSSSKYIYEIDSVTAAEIVNATTFSVIGSLTGIRTRGGGIEASGLMDYSTVFKLINHPYVSLEIVDRLSGTTIMQISQCIFDQDSLNIPAKGVLELSADFKGIFCNTDNSGSAAGSAFTGSSNGFA